MEIKEIHEIYSISLWNPAYSFHNHSFAVREGNIHTLDDSTRLIGVFATRLGRIACIGPCPTPRIPQMLRITGVGNNPPPFQVKLAEIGPAVLKIRRGGGLFPGRKWDRKWDQKLPKSGPLPGRPDARKHNENKGFWLKIGPPGGHFWYFFGAQNGSIFWAKTGPQRNAPGRLD